MSESKGSAHRAQRTRKGFMDFWPPGLGRGGHFDLSICSCSLQRTTWTPRRHFVKVRLATKPALNVEGAGPLRQKPWPDRGRRSSVIVQRVREMALRGKELSPCPEPRGERAVVVTGRKSNYVVSVKKPRSRTERGFVAKASLRWVPSGGRCAEAQTYWVASEKCGDSTSRCRYGVFVLYTGTEQGTGLSHEAPRDRCHIICRSVTWS